MVTFTIRTRLKAPPRAEQIILPPEPLPLALPDPVLLNHALSRAVITAAPDGAINISARTLLEAIALALFVNYHQSVPVMVCGILVGHLVFCPIQKKRTYDFGLKQKHLNPYK